MANEPKVLNVNGYQTTTEKVSGGQGTSSATVSSAPKELQKSEQSQVGVDLTNVKGTATGNTEERSLKVSKDATVGSYVADTNRAGNPGRTKRNIVNTVTVEEVKALIKKYGGGNSYSKEQIDEMLATIREGQYVKVDTTEYPTLEDFLASEGEQGTVYLYPVGNEENNYYQYIWEVSEWVSLGTTALDLSNYPTLDGNNTYSGDNTFVPAVYLQRGTFEKKFVSVSPAGELIFGSGNSIYYYARPTDFSPAGNRDLGSESDKWKDLYLSGSLRDGNNAYYGYTLPDSTSLTANSELVDTASAQTISGNKTFGNILFSGNIAPNNSTGNYFNWYAGKLAYRINASFVPATNGTRDIGASDLNWKDLYIAGEIKDGTNSVNIADLKALIDYAKAQGWIS